MRKIKGYMASFHKRKNTKIYVKEVTLLEIGGIYYHIEIEGDLLVGEDLRKPIEENNKVYIYDCDENSVLVVADEYIRNICY
ncbi:hypothetical protein ABIA69_004744 [Lysinibacillus parviboronicapiens]|uniref:Uncharacterized protein n=2 Tax=Lysinibacillus parviboronicapiens TaxID=436516 RepID=A0ABV2PSK8_9BACI|nr:hypothetical protein [Lysinibacillus parviboronicapiens]